jgi:hypothetical protein
MKTKNIFLSVILGLFLFSGCTKEITSTASLSDEDAKNYEQMRYYYDLAITYEDSLVKCQDSLISNCNFDTHDSLFHYCIDQWEHYHDMYSHNNNVDDHHHSMMGEHHNHCNHCNEIDHHSVEDHQNLNSLLTTHRNKFH